ncbi:MAG: hypothetical protein JWR37_4365, partial [Mycobacterium sp.]|nr:hypothetical protein [Mycobacterium sp.]
CGDTSQHGGADSDARSVWAQNARPYPDLAHRAQTLGTHEAPASCAATVSEVRGG